MYDEDRVIKFASDDDKKTVEVTAHGPFIMLDDAMCVRVSAIESVQSIGGDDPWVRVTTATGICEIECSMDDMMGAISNAEGLDQT